MSQSSPIILFDGVCNLCNGTVQFLLFWEVQPIFKFANLQSSYGEKQLRKYSLPTEVLETIVLIEGEKILLRSKAVLRILSYLKFPWPLFKIFFIVPNYIRDLVYNWITTKRYIWFGRSEKCILPDPDLESRFIQ